MTSKAITGALAAVLLTTAMATPADAQNYRRYDDRRYDDRRYDDGDDQRASVDACAYEAEREAGRRFGSSERVDVNDVGRDRDGLRVRGTVEVQDRYGYGRRDRYRRGGERVAFVCTARYGEVTGLSLGSGYARGY